MPRSRYASRTGRCGRQNQRASFGYVGAGDAADRCGFQESGPPSLESCTRDIYPLGQSFSLVVLCIARGILHGDLYAHNILWNEQGDALLGDFGAASFMPRAAAHRGERVRLLVGIIARALRRARRTAERLVVAATPLWEHAGHRATFVRRERKHPGADALMRKRKRLPQEPCLMRGTAYSSLACAAKYFATPSVDAPMPALPLLHPAGQTSPCSSWNCNASTMRSISSMLRPSGRSFTT